MNNEIKNAVDIAQRAQRNYDLSKTIPTRDLETLIYAAANSPSKQNVIHYQLKVYTDQKIIQEIHKHTKNFTLHLPGKTDGIIEVRDSQVWHNPEYSVTNSQTLANALFIYINDSDHSKAIAGDHLLYAQQENKNEDSVVQKIFKEQQTYSIGISVGELILSAALLGYKTGLCSGFNQEKVNKIINAEEEIRLIVGIGFENVGMDRRLHAETLNKDIVNYARNGELHEHWRFPSFNKDIRVTING